MFSVYGENLTEDDLLFLKSGTSNVKIDVHNSTDSYRIVVNNDAIDASRSNISYNLKLDDNDDISASMIRKEQRKLDITYDDFFNFEQINDNPVNTSISISQPVFTDPVLNIDDDHYVCTLYSDFNVPLINGGIFLDQSGNQISLVSGVGFQLSIPNGIILESLKTFSNANIKILPENLRVYAKTGNIWTEIHNQTRLELDRTYTLDYVGIHSDTFLIVINKVYFHISDSLNNFSSLSSLRQDNNFKVQIGYIELYGANKYNSDYHLSFMNKSLVNINSLSTDKLILNNKLYTDFLSKNDIADLNFRLSDYTNQTTFESLLTPVLHDSTIFMQNDVIPIVNKTSLDDGSFLFEYHKSINADHIKQLYNLGNSNIDGILKQDIQGNIYKSNTIDTINTSNISVDDNITLNNNKLKWNDSIYRFTHSDDNNQIQDLVFDCISIEPKIDSDNIRILESNTLFRFNTNEEQYGQNNWNNDRIFMSFSNVDNDIIYTLSQSSPSQYDNIPLFDNLYNYIIGDTNLLTSRLGSTFNPERNAYNPFNDIYDKLGNPNQSSSFIYKFIDDHSNEHYYGDFFQLDLNKDVVLHKISWINIQNEPFSTGEYDPERNDYNKQMILNTLKSFIVLGYNIELAKWELLLNVDSYQHSISNIEHIFQISRKNRSYRHIRLGITSLHVHTTVRTESSEYTPEPTKELYYNEEVAKASDTGNTHHVYTTYHNERPVAIKNLKFHCQFKKQVINNVFTTPLNSVLSTEQIHIKNNDLNTNYKTRLIINDDYFNGSSNNNAIFHINDTEHVENEEVHFMKLCLKKPNYYELFQNGSSEENAENCVIHSMNIDDVDRTFYNIHVANYPNSENLLKPPVLSITDSGKNNDERQPSISINVDQHLLDTSGLFVSPKITLYNQDCSNCIHIQPKDQTSNYTIILPEISDSKQVSQNSFLRVVNSDNNILSTEWGVPEDTLFTSYDIYIGKSENSNLLDISSGHIYCNMDTPENMVHIRKMFVGMSETIHQPGHEEQLVEDINKYVAYFGGKIYASSDVTTDSDISYKHSLEILNKPRYKIEQLTGYTFDRNDTEENRRFCGLIAQDVEKVLPEAVLKKHDGKLRVMYNNLSALFVESLKEVYTELDQLKKEVRSYRATP